MPFAWSDVRKARKDAHDTFDLIWLERHLSRDQAYIWLAGEMGMSGEKCHISLFDIGLCEAVEWLARRKLRQLRKLKKAAGTGWVDLGNRARS